MADLFKPSRALELHKSECFGVLIRNIRQELVFWNEQDVQVFLQLLKESFGLRAPRSNLTLPLGSSPYRMGFRAFGGRSPKFGRGGPPRQSSPHPNMRTSAAALFLGPDLMHILGME